MPRVVRIKFCCLPLPPHAVTPQWEHCYRNVDWGLGKRAVRESDARISMFCFFGFLNA
jgi:hypothetical protein